MLAALIIVFDQIDCEPSLWYFQSVPGQKRERDRQPYRETDGEQSKLQTDRQTDREK